MLFYQRRLYVITYKLPKKKYIPKVYIIMVYKHQTWMTLQLITWLWMLCEVERKKTIILKNLERYSWTNYKNQQRIYIQHNETDRKSYKNPRLGQLEKTDVFYFFFKFNILYVFKMPINNKTIAYNFFSSTSDTKLYFKWIIQMHKCTEIHVNKKFSWILKCIQFQCKQQTWATTFYLICGCCFWYC